MWQAYGPPTATADLVVRCCRAALYRRLVLVLPWATMVVRGTGSEGLAVCAMSSTVAPSSRCRAGDADVTADDPGKPPAVTLATMERLSSLGSTDAVKMRTSVTSMRIEGSSSTTSTVSPKFPCGISAHAVSGSSAAPAAPWYLGKYRHTTAPYRVSCGAVPAGRPAAAVTGHPRRPRPARTVAAANSFR